MHYYFTCGDPAGIGPEIFLRFLANFSFECEKEDKMFVFASKAVFYDRLKDFSPQLAQRLEKSLASLVANKIEGFSFIDVEPQCALEQLSRPGMFAGHHAYLLLEKGCEQIKKELVHSSKVIFITGPIDKSSIVAALASINPKDLRVSFQGHTEYLAKYFSCLGEEAMCFITPLFQIILATTHIPLSQVSCNLTEKNLSNAIKKAFFLQQMVGDTFPLMVFGLNPHAGEKGLFGHEEKMITKVIDFFRQKGAKIEGPLSADGAIRLAARQARQGIKRTIVACYHDQGLVAAKLSAIDYDSVHLTLGLPFLRFSVDHGTAYDARGQADERSLQNVFSVAMRMSKNMVQKSS